MIWGLSTRWRSLRIHSFLLLLFDSFFTSFCFNFLNLLFRRCCSMNSSIFKKLKNVIQKLAELVERKFLPVHMCKFLAAVFRVHFHHTLKSSNIPKIQKMTESEPKELKENHRQFEASLTYVLVLKNSKCFNFDKSSHKNESLEEKHANIFQNFHANFCCFFSSL